MSKGGPAVTECSDPPLFAAQEWDACCPAEAVVADSASAFGNLFSQYASEMGISAQECEAASPRFIIRRISDNASSTGRITQYAHAGAKLNLLRNVEGS